MSTGQTAKVAALVTIGVLFRLLLLLGIAAIAAVDILFFAAESHGSALLLTAVLLILCLALAWYTLRPVVAPGRTHWGRRRAAPKKGSAARQAKARRKGDPRLADTTWQ